MRSYFYSKLVALAAVIGLSSLFLMFQTLTDDRPEMWVKPGMLFDKPTTEQLATNARIKGKIAVVEKKQFAAPSDIHIDGHFNKQGITGTEYFPEEMYAAIPEELETLIKIEYNKGKLINHVRTRGGIPDVVEIYSCLIDISVIDYKTSTVIARERLEEKKIPGDGLSMDIPRLEINHVKDYSGRYRYEYVIPVTERTKQEVRTRLGKFSDRVKPLK